MVNGIESHGKEFENISPKIRQILLHCDCELTESDLL